MNKIKIIGSLVFIVSTMLALLSSYIATQNREHSRDLNFINRQKDFTQEISKSIFYSYRNGDNGSKNLDITIKKYIKNAKINESEFTKNRQIITLWNRFYEDVQKFRNQQKITTGYNSVITAKLVNRIYHNNVLLVNEFNKLIKVKQIKHHNDMNDDKQLQYILFFILLGLLIYLFTQVHLIIAFIQKFSKASKNIIENSTIQGLKPIEKIEQEVLEEATSNYNHLVKKINSSIAYSTSSMSQTTKSLEDVEKNIEDFMELLSAMQEENSDELFQKEDVIIDSLETLMNLKNRLKSLENELKDLI
ncbi:MAG: hypothetical protein KAG56_07650 [Sulfurovaceae bacterium]|nr:hypothetical protein [Sulfurovaceae bacterium]